MLKDSVRYGASEAPKNPGPGPHSRPTEPPGAGRVFFWDSLPLPPPLRLFPRRAPVK